MLAAARTQARTLSLAERWVEGLLDRLNADPAFRVQALRFIDVLPSLTDDSELVRLFNEYFDTDQFPLPRFGGLALQAGRLLGEHALAAMIRHAAEMLSRQFLAGQDAGSVLARVAELEALGRQVSLDRVGEVILSESEAEQYLQANLDLIAAAVAAGRSALHLSVKLSALYSRAAAHNLDHSVEKVLARLLRLARAARDAGAAITLDMEDYDRRPLILAVFQRWVTHPEFADWPGAGVALQAYLRDAPADLEDLIALAGRRAAPFGVRLVRGAYWDQECIRAQQHGWPIPVWRRQWETDQTYEACTERLIAAHPLIHCAIATHNPRSLAYAMACAERHGRSSSELEIQMLYGMAEPLQDALQSLGYTVRVYLPFGEPIPGMAYLVRRLLENSSSQSLARLSLAGEADAPVLLGAPVAMPDGEAAEEHPAFVNQAPRRFVTEPERQAFANAIERVRGELGGEYSLSIGAQEQTTASCIESLCPAEPALLVGSVAAAGHSEVDQALQAAADAFPSWREHPVGARADLLRAAAQRLCTMRDEFAAWEIFEVGKTWTEADADVCEAIDFLRYYADQAERLAEDRGVRLPGEDNRHGYQPRGIGVVIPPWNFPLAILTGMLAATLVSGNCAILKPASDSPVVAARLVRLLREIGVPPGVLGFIPGRGAEVGDYLVTHAAVHLVAFTGSREVGCGLLQRAATLAPRQRYIKRVIAEMGGKNAIIVDASADPDEATAGILQSAFGFQGQKCSACSRVIVVGDLHDGLVDRLVAATSDLVIDLPWQPHTDLGPVINCAARERIETIITESRQWGRPVYRGLLPQDLQGHFVAPAVFDGVDPASPLAQREIFGPVLAVIKCRDFDQALAIANDTDYALTGGVYSRSPAHLRKAAERFRVGNLYLNRGITGALVARQPFGGFKLSGVGSKAGGPDYLLQFMEARCVTENTLRRGVAPEL